MTDINFQDLYAIINQIWSICKKSYTLHNSFFGSLGVQLINITNSFQGPVKVPPMNRNIVNGNSASSSRSSKPSSNVKSEKESGYESFQEYPGDSFEKVSFVTARKTSRKIYFQPRPRDNFRINSTSAISNDVIFRNLKFQSQKLHRLEIFYLQNWPKSKS